MLEFDVSQIEIQFDYSGSELLDIRRCLKTLYATPAGTVALDRDFGLNWNMVDMPMETAKSVLTVEIIEKTARYESRVEVTKVTYTETIDGKLYPKVVIRYVGNE